MPEGVTPVPLEVLLPPKVLLGLRKDPAQLEKHSDSKDAKASISKELNQVTPPTSQGRNSNANQDLSQHITEALGSELGHPSGESKMQYKPPEDEQSKAPEVPACLMLKDKLDEEPESVGAKLPSDKMLPIPDRVCASLLENKRVTPNTHWQDVRLLTFLIQEGYDYYVGDTITIYPKNFPEDVQALIDLMDWNEVADTPLVFNNTGIRDYASPTMMHNVPEGFVKLPNSTLRDLLTHNLDITAIPKRYFFELAANHCSDPTHELRLREFANAAYTDEYYDYATRPRRSILEVLHDFPTVRFPFSWALAVFPIIRGRVYSICSGGVKKKYRQPGLIKLEILVAMVKYKTVLKKIRQGLCSRYLDSLQPGTMISSVLSITNDSNPWFLNSEKEDHLIHPVICVGPGTGIAPCRALMWQRGYLEFQRRHQLTDKLDRPVGKAYMFFGGRNRAADFFFKEEYLDNTVQAKVFTAFSRDQEKKRYVQDILRVAGQTVADLILNQEARIFVCGSSGNMPKAVREAFVDVLEKWDPEERGRGFAEAVVADLEKQKRYMQETW